MAWHASQQMHNAAMGNPPLRRLHLPERITPPAPPAAEQRRQRLATGHIIIVTGGRDYPHRGRVFSALDLAHSRKAVTLLMHGACNAHTGQMTGADRWAHEWAEERGVTLDPHPANWQMWNKAAGPMRNKQMAELGAHGVIAFKGDRGTRSMLHWARAFSIQCWAPYRDEWTEDELSELFGK